MNMAQHKLSLPLQEVDTLKLRVGDVIYVSGTLFMARDEAHHRALDLAKQGKSLPIPTEGLGVFHCGPVVKQSSSGIWKVMAAGPTTSSRMNIFEPEFIEKFGIRLVIGKGGMDDRTLEALRKFKAVYCAFTGGAGVLATRGIRNSEMKEVHWLDLGTPEALWVFEADSFGPLIVAMDAFGGSLYNQVREQARNNIKNIEKKLGLTLS